MYFQWDVFSGGNFCFCVNFLCAVKCVEVEFVVMQ